MTITNSICGHNIYKREKIADGRQAALSLLHRVLIRSPQPSYRIKSRRQHSQSGGWIERSPICHHRSQTAASLFL